MSTQQNILLVEHKPPFAWLTLNRPTSMNALNTELLIALKDACRQLSADKTTAIAVITGAEDRVFCAGADLKERKEMTDQQVLKYIELIRETFAAIEHLPQVVIAAINGASYGGGTELVLACDLRIMVKQATLALTEVTLGIIPGAGGTQRLSRLIGKSMAKEIILTATPITAERAFDIGLVHKLTAANNLVSETQAWATHISKAAPLSLRHAKLAIDEGYDKSFKDGMAAEFENYKKLLSSLDRQEALKAFSEKRPPHFTGR